MKIVSYSTKQYDKLHLSEANEQQGYRFDIDYFDFPLNKKTTKMAVNADAVSIFVNDDASRAVLEELAVQNIKILALRCAGFNNVDLNAAEELGIKVVRVPAYSPEAVAEHTVGLMLCLNRRIHRAYQRTRDANFSLEGLTGINLHQRTAGIIGTGKIGLATLRILNGFGMKLLAYDPYPNPEAIKLGVSYVDLPTLLSQSDVISLHCPMTPENHYLLSEQAFNQMKDGVMIINTSRGGLIDSKAAINAIESRKIGALGMDVYEKERELFFEDNSNDVINDTIFRRLSSCHNVLFTGHQAFLTVEALSNISETTLKNVYDELNGIDCGNAVTNI